MEEMMLNWHSPIWDPSGYAYVGRHILKELLKKGVKIGLDEYFQWNPSLRNLAKYGGESLHRQLQKTRYEGSPNIELVIPDAFKYYSQGKRIGYTMFEVDRISDIWALLCNKMDEVFVPSHFNYETFKSSGVKEEKLKVMPFGVDVDLFKPDVEPFELLGPKKNDFIFFSDYQHSIRKGWDVLLRAFCHEFKAEENVCLVLKTYEAIPNDPRSEVKIMREMYSVKSEFDTTPRIYWYKPMVRDQDLPRLYKCADAFISTSRGEGFNLPLIQCMAMGIPTIATGWSGHMEYANKNNCFLIDYELVKTHEEMLWHPGYAGAFYAEPDLGKTRELMRYVFENPENAKEVGIKAMNEIREKYTWEKAADRIVERVFHGV